MPKVNYLIVYLIIALLLVGCTREIGDMVSVPETQTAVPVEYAEVITAEDVGEYYGFPENLDDKNGGAIRIKLPARMVVREPLLEDGSNATAPVFNNEEIWIGEFSVGTIVDLSAISLDGNWCLVEGTTLGGWTSKGWVLCYRLSDEE